MNAPATLFGELTGALFSPCRTWRYRLWRIWDASLPRAVFVLMNPSTATEVDDDATVLRQQRRVQKWAELGYDIPLCGGVEVVNVFAWRETDSTLLEGLIASRKDIVGPENDRHILEAVSAAGIVICGWGQPGNQLDRGQAVLELLRGAGVKPHALKLNDDGTPTHPLYLAYSMKPIPLACGRI